MLGVFAASAPPDAQRASVTVAQARIDGTCFTSKHPKRRHAKEMPFHAPLLTDLFPSWVTPLVGRGPGFDYVFPRVAVPRGGSLLSESARFLSGAASSSQVIKHMRALLSLPPLSLSVEQAKLFTGHSLRHLMPTLARALGVSQEDREELGRWLAGGSSR